jgi:hypothetical protein
MRATLGVPVGRLASKRHLLIVCRIYALAAYENSKSLSDMTEAELNQIWDTLARGQAITGWISWSHQDLDMLRHRTSTAFKTWKRGSDPRTAWAEA